MKQLELKGYANDNDFIVVDSQGMSAFMVLTQLLWSDKIGADKAKIEYDTIKKTITVKTKQFTYKFTNAPLQWGGSIDTHQVYADHLQDLRESEVI